MAVWVYKDGESSLIEAKRLQNHLKAGWSVTNGDEIVEADTSESDEPSDAPTFEEADTNGTGKLSVGEVRAAAKGAGIEGWDTKRINTLKEVLGYE